jgi:hypothetical protein
MIGADPSLIQGDCQKDQNSNQDHSTEASHSCHEGRCFLQAPDQRDFEIRTSAGDDQYRQCSGTDGQSLFGSSEENHRTEHFAKAVPRVRREFSHLFLDALETHASDKIVGVNIGEIE